MCFSCLFSAHLREGMWNVRFNTTYIHMNSINHLNILSIPYYLTLLPLVRNYICNHDINMNTLYGNYNNFIINEKRLNKLTNTTNIYVSVFK